MMKNILKKPVFLLFGCAFLRIHHFFTPRVACYFICLFRKKFQTNIKEQILFALKVNVLSKLTFFFFIFISQILKKFLFFTCTEKFLYYQV